MRHWDRELLYGAAFTRALTTGMSGVLLGLYLAKLELSPVQVGLTVSAGLAGGALATMAVTLYGDRLGRRHSLVALSLLSMLGAMLLTLLHDPLALILAAFVGMLNGMGRDRSASAVLETVILADTTEDKERTRAIAQYTMLQDIGHALGGLLAGLPELIQHGWHIRAEQAYGLPFLGMSALMLLAGAVYLGLSPAVERRAVKQAVSLSPESRRVLIKISALFSLDSLGGGFLTTALLSFFFYERFGVEAATLGGLFFLARVANAFSHLGAAWLAKRIGLVNTMVFTHIPSSLLLVTVAYAPSFPVAAVLFLLREGLVEMDVPTRQSYVLAVVKPEERTLASGVTQLVRVGAWAIAPAFAGLFMQTGKLMVPLILGAGMKITYDILLYIAFRKVKPREEQDAA